MIALCVAERNAVEPVMVTTVCASALPEMAAATETERMMALIDFMMDEGFRVDGEKEVLMFCAIAGSNFPAHMVLRRRHFNQRRLGEYWVPA